MRPFKKFALPVAGLFIGLLFSARAAHAQTSSNCPGEPKENVPIADGETYLGSNCVLHTAADVDSFVFKAHQGQTWSLALGAVNGKTNDICLTVYDPNNNKINSGCTAGFDFTVVFQTVLPTTGTYTLDVTEVTSGAQEYAVSTERVFPFAPDAQSVALSQIYPGDIAWDTESNAFTFMGVTTGLFQVSAAVNPPKNYDLCMTVYYANGVVAGSGCTAGFNYNIDIDFTPASNGEMLAFLNASGWNGTVSYNFEVSCLSGNCGKVKYPPCTLTDNLSYTPNTLTMNFTVGNKYAATWNVWLTDQNTMSQLFSVKQPITIPPQPIQKTTPLSPNGKVGVLSTLTTPTQGITCSSWEEINTGAP